MMKFKEFYKDETEPPSIYSIKGFSMLNAFAALEFLRLEYIPVKADLLKNKPYRKVYFIKPTDEKEIRNKLYEGVPKFLETKEKFLRTFRDLEWDKYFAEFFPLKSKD